VNLLNVPADFPRTAIKTHHGNTIDFADLDPAQIDIRDIAHHLSLIARYSGGTQRMYSVGEHSLRMMRALDAAGDPERLQIIALLHDGSEYAMADVPAPLKRMCRDYRRIEGVVQAAIYKRFLGDYPSWEEMKRVKAVDYANEEGPYMSSVQAYSEFISAACALGLAYAD